MKKNLFPFIVIIGVSILLCGCTKEVNVFKEVNDISNGRYKIKDSEAGLFSPYIYVDLENNTFIFTHDLLSSRLNVGTITIEDEKVIARGDNKMYNYVFHIVDENTLRFDQTNSTVITTRENHHQIVDGTEFVLVHE